MNVHVALLHYPVYNRQRQIIISSVTNLDIHDIARAALTYGVHRFYLVTPLKDQLQLIQRSLYQQALEPSAPSLEDKEC